MSLYYAWHCMHVIICDFIQNEIPHQAWKFEIIEIRRGEKTCIMCKVYSKSTMVVWHPRELNAEKKIGGREQLAKRENRVWTACANIVDIILTNGTTAKYWLINYGKDVDAIAILSLPTSDVLRIDSGLYIFGFYRWADTAAPLFW